MGIISNKEDHNEDEGEDHNYIFWIIPCQQSALSNRLATGREKVSFSLLIGGGPISASGGGGITAK